MRAESGESRERSHYMQIINRRRHRLDGPHLHRKLPVALLDAQPCNPIANHHRHLRHCARSAATAATNSI